MNGAGLPAPFFCQSRESDPGPSFFGERQDGPCRKENHERLYRKRVSRHGEKHGMENCDDYKGEDQDGNGVVTALFPPTDEPERKEEEITGAEEQPGTDGSAVVGRRSKEAPEFPEVRQLLADKFHRLVLCMIDIHF